jgi:hypothetical protein
VEEKVINIMLDIETLGEGRDAAIAAVGSCRFDREGEIRDVFYMRTDLKKSRSPGVLDPSTVYWWLRQDEEVRNEIVPDSGTSNLEVVLAAWAHWAGTIGGHVKDRCLWTNGPTFDESIMRDAFIRNRLEFPTNFRDSRCCRTIYAQGKHLPKMEREGSHHNALDDCIYQAKSLARIIRSKDLVL